MRYAVYKCFRKDNDDLQVHLVEVFEFEMQAVNRSYDFEDDKGRLYGCTIDLSTGEVIS